MSSAARVYTRIPPSFRRGVREAIEQADQDPDVVLVPSGWSDRPAMIELRSGMLPAHVFAFLRSSGYRVVSVTNKGDLTRVHVKEDETDD